MCRGVRYSWVFVSAYQMMRQRLNIPDDEGWEGPSDRELAEFG
jgi:hypothetical protein